MKHLKRVIAFVLLLSMLLNETNNQAVYAQVGNEEYQKVSSSFEDNSDYEVVNNMMVRAATEEEYAFLFSFIPRKDRSGETLIECSDVLDNCVEVRRFETGDHTVRELELNNMNNLFPDAIHFTAAQIDTGVNVAWVTEKNEEIFLTIDNDSVIGAVYYQPNGDYAIVYENGYTQFYINYRYGTQVRLTDEAEKRIIEQTSNPEESSALHNSVSLTSTRGMSKNDRTFWVNRIQSIYETYNHTVLQQNMYCNAIGGNVPIHVLDIRPSFYWYSADANKDFIVNTFFSSIAGWLGFTATVYGCLSLMLTAMSVAYSASKLDEGCNLSRVPKVRAGKYKAGQAYDSLLYNAYVEEVRYSGTEEYTGGFDVNGVFHIVQTGYSTSDSVNNSTIASETLTAYNSWAAYYLLNHPYGPD